VREITVDFLGTEAARLRAILVQKPIYHPSGVRVYSPGEPITPDVVTLMKESGMKNLFILEPGETEFKALSALDLQKVEPRELVAGDVLAEDLSGPDGAVIAYSGQVLDAAGIARARGARRGPVGIRRRGAEAAQKQARDFLARRPPPPVRGVKSDERVTEFIRTALIQVRPLLVPVGRVAVGVQEEFTRALVHNTLAGAGYEVIGWNASLEGLDELRSRKADLLVIDLEDALSLCLAVRKSDDFRGMGILVCAEDSRKQEITSVLLDGANDSVHRPPPPDMLLYKVRICLQVMGLSVNLPPAILMERRKAPRIPVGVPCALRDPSRPKSLPVSSGTLVDLTEGGAQVAYARPDWPCRHAFQPHGVHPRHFLCDYAKSGLNARELAVSFSVPGAGKRERLAKVVHVGLSGGREVAGLAFQKAR
jgi:CheY-like chemotaxis protein